MIAKESSLKSRFWELATPPKGAFAAVPVRSGDDHWWLARDDEGRAALLVSETASKGGPSLETARLIVHRKVQCRIVADGHSFEGRFTVALTRDADPTVANYFIDLCLDLEAWHREGGESVGDIFLLLASFFQRLATPAVDSQQGLFGELLLILGSTRPSDLARAWHRSADDPYDFSTGLQRLEVKTSRGERRVHHFRHRQLAERGLLICIVSCVVESNAEGTTVADLVDELVLTPGLSVPDRLRIREVASGILGSDWLDSHLERYDRDLASRSTRFLRATDIPSINPNYPAEVTNVAFLSDVTSVPPMPRDEISNQSLWSAALPSAEQAPG